MTTLARAAALARDIELAREAAAAAASHAGVTIGSLHDVVEQAAVSDLAARVWRSSDTSALDPGLLRVLAHTGNLVIGAFAGDELVGMSVGFRTGNPADGLHSHMTCTAESWRGVGLGFALKQHQRWWAITQGLTAITWTFDPLVSRNAFFNLAKLGAVVVEYLPNFYGPMSDGLNAGDESDRLLVSWPTASGPGPDSAERCATSPGPMLLSVAPDGSPVVNVADADVVGAQVPSDIVALRDRDPALARRWRHALRTALMGAFSRGHRITGFTRDGCYVLSRVPPAVGTAAEGR